MALNHRSVLRSASLILTAVLVVLGASFAAGQSVFDDVPEDAYYADAVQWLVDEGLANGGVDGTFRPEEAVNRGETAVFLWRLVGQPDAPVHRFTDVTVGWQDDAVSWMAAAGITQGATPTTFDPNGIVTRGALSVFLHRLAGEPPAPPHSFTDVDGPVLQAPVSWIAATGISSGVAPGEFGPDVPVVRGQMAVFLQRLGESGMLDVRTETTLPELTAPPEVERRESSPSVATISVNPTSPRVAERIEVRGSGFTMGSVLVTIGDEVAGVVEANASGSFALSIPVPDVDQGVQTVAAVSDGEVTASAQIDVRPAAPSSNLLPVLVLLVGAGGAGWWWWRQRRNPVSTSAEDVEETPPEAEPSHPARVDPKTSDVFSVVPVAAGMLDTLAELDGTVWASAQIDFDGVGHAMVLTMSGRGQDWDVIADLGPGHIDAVSVSDRDAVAIGSRFVFDE
ncbi:MAG: S-layer homology domain-containing protein, partial [Acidimicrobiia bacterium]|nr:S-layer homology domain-containing protein [Acidimicrobiia bacterium]